MKKFLFSFLTALLCAFMWNSVSARLIQSDRIPAKLIKAGDTIALECGTPGNHSNYFLGFNDKNELQNVTPFGARTTWIVSDGPLNSLGEKTYYLQNLNDLSYLGAGKEDPMVNGTGSLGPTKSIEEALPLSIYSAEDSSEVNNDYAPIWDNESAVLCFKHDNGDYNFLGNCGYWGITTVWFWKYHDTNAWNIYKVIYEKDMQGDLQALIDEISESGIEYESGTAPGLYPQAKVEAFNTALEEALLTSMQEGLSDEVYKAAMDKLTNAKYDLEHSVNPIVEGYYYVVSAYSNFMNSQGKEMAWTAYTNNWLGWTTFNYLDPSQVFKFTPLPSGNFTIQNYDTDLYVNGATEHDGGSAVVCTSTPGYEQIAEPIGSLQWLFYNTDYNVAYHPRYHNSGNGSGGEIVPYNANKLNQHSTWYIRMVPDSVMQKLPAIKVQIALNRELSNLATEANGIFDKLTVYTVDTVGAITNATDDDPGNQVSSNAKDPGEGSYAALIDGKTTIFHSTWHVDNDPLTVPHNLQFDLSSKPVTGFQMKMIQRCDSWGTKDRPCIIKFYATNDPAAEDAWTFIRQVDLTSSWPNNTENYQNRVTTPVIDLGKAYSHVRMDVIATQENRKNAGAQYPFFSLAELQIYPVVLDETLSQYCYIEGLAPKADNMRKLATEAVAKVANSTVTTEDVAALKAAINDVKALYADTTEITSLLGDLQNYVNTAVYGTGIGETTEEATTALQTAINEAKGSSFTTPLVKAEVDAALQKLTTAKEAFMTTVKMPEADKWYYIISASRTETHFNGGDQTAPLPMANSALYADGPSTGDHIRYGLLDESGQPNYTYNANAMWRFVKIEGSEDYALQCMGTGQYMGDGSAIKTGASIYTALQPIPYTAKFLGNASFSLVPQANMGTKNALVACLTGQHAEVNEATVYGDGSWKFIEINPEQTECIIINTFARNLMDVFTMPFNVEDLTGYNEDAQLYGIKKMTKNEDNTTTIELYAKESAKAGESCILVNGVPGEEIEECELIIPLPTEFASKATPSNGIYGMITGETAPAGTAYSEGAKFKVATKETSIGAYTGIINPAYYTGEVEGVETALTLTVEGLVWPTTDAGDVNGDGRIDATDVVTLYNYIASGTESGVSLEAADVNGDGKVDGADVVEVYNIASGSTAQSGAFGKEIVGATEIIPADQNDKALLTISVGSTTDLAKIPVSVILTNPEVTITAVEGCLFSPAGVKSFLYDEDEGMFVFDKTDRWRGTHGNTSFAGTDRHGMDWFFFSIVSSTSANFKGTDGVIATFYFDGSKLGDGEYEIKLKDAISVWTDKRDTKTYDAKPMSSTFTISGGKATGVEGVEAESGAKAGSAITVDGKAASSLQKGQIYIIDGKKVKL